MAIETSYAKVEWKGGVVAEGTSRGFKVTMDEPERMAVPIQP